MNAIFKALRTRFNKLLLEKQQILIQREVDKIQRRNYQKKFYKPGSLKYALAYQQNPLDLMRDVVERRKNEREEKKMEKT